MNNTPTSRFLDFERIWLQPKCCAGEDGRLWCENNAPEDCPDGEPWTEYVRADLAVEDALAILREALEWWETVKALESPTSGISLGNHEWVRKARETLGEDK